MKVRLLLAVIVLAFSCSLVNGEILSNTLVVNDIEYYMQVNDSVFDLGEDVETLFKVTNLGDVTLSIVTFYPVIDIIVSEKVGEVYNEIWNWSWDKFYPLGTLPFELQPGEFIELNGIWPQIDLNNSGQVEDHTQAPPGIYSVVGYFWPTLTNVGVDITITPEPATALLFGMGLLCIRRNKHISLRRKSY